MLMPFTFSQPANVLQLIFLSEKRISLADYVTENLTLGFEFFLNGSTKRVVLYRRIFLFSVSLGVILALIVRRLVRDKCVLYPLHTLKARFSRLKKTFYINSACSSFTQRHPESRFILTIPSHQAKGSLEISLDHRNDLIF